MSNTKQSWEEYLKATRYKDKFLNDAPMYKELLNVDVRKLGLWRKTERRAGGKLWANGWSDIVQIASQVLKEGQ